MKAFKFFKIDFARSRIQFIYMLVFSAIAMALSLKTDGPYLGLIYMIFASIIFSTVPFTLDQRSEIGFVNLLPGSVKDRVSGRFLLAFIMVIFGTLMGSVVMGLYYLLSHTGIELAFAFILGATGVGILFASIQYIIFYILGKVNSVQAMGIVRMLPAFVMFFGTSYLSDYFRENPGELLDWLLKNANLLGAVILAVSIVVYFIGIAISTAIIEKRDNE